MQPLLSTLFYSTRGLGSPLIRQERMLYKTNTDTDIHQYFTGESCYHSPAVTPTHLVDAEMALKPAAVSIIERYLH